MERPLVISALVGEFAGDMDDVGARHAGHALGPGRRVRLVLVVVRCDASAAETTVQAIIGAQEIEHRRDRCRPVLQRQGAHRNVTHHDIRMLGRDKTIGRGAAEIGKRHLFGRRTAVDQAEAQRRFRTVAAPLFQVPLALFAPAEADRTKGHDRVAVGVQCDGLPGRIVRFVQRVREVVGAHQAVRDIAAVLAHQPHQHRQIGVFADVVLEVGHRSVEVEFAQNDVTHRHGQRGVGALLGMQPQIGEFSRLGVVRRNDGALGALVADLGVKMRVGRAGLRHVRTPDQQIAGVVPVRTFRHVRLLAPGHRAGRRQVAIPVVKRQADAAQQRKVARTGGERHHRHRRDWRETDHAVRAIFLDCVSVGGGDDLVDFIPSGADQAAQAALAGVAVALFRTFHDRGPGRDRGKRRPCFAPQFEQAPAHHRVFHAVGRVQIPGVAGATGAAAGFVVRQIRPRARIIGLLRLPRNDAALDVDFP